MAARRKTKKIPEGSVLKIAIAAHLPNGIFAARLVYVPLPNGLEVFDVGQLHMVISSMEILSPSPKRKGWKQ